MESKKPEDQSIEFVKMLREHYASYHNHKETMAHAGLVVQIALCAAVLSMEPWPPDWIPGLKISPKYVVLVGYFILWLLIYIFTCWQLEKRSEAAEYVRTQIAYLKSKLYPEDKDHEEIDKLHSKKGTPTTPTLIIVLANFFILGVVVVKTLNQ